MSTTPPSGPWHDPKDGSRDPSDNGGGSPAPGSAYPPPSYPPPPPPPAPPPHASGGYPPPPGYPPPGGGYPPPGYPPPPPGYPPYPSYGGGWQGQPGMTGGYLAGWWTRVGATIIDALVVGLATAIILVAVGDQNGRLSFADLSVSFIYQVILLGVRRSQTVGMMALGTRVVDANTGGPIGFPRSIGRAAVYTVLAFTIIGGILDILWPLWDRRNQTLHDKAIGSVLIHIR